MLQTLAISNYRTLLDVVIPLKRLNLVVGPNGSGKSNLYRALRLLAETAQDGVIRALALEGGLPSTLWAGPEKISRAMRAGEASVQGGPRTAPVRLRLGFAEEEYGYAITFGFPPPSEADSLFQLDPQIKTETIWAGPYHKAGSALVNRRNAVISVRKSRSWECLEKNLTLWDSMFRQIADPNRAPSVVLLREMVRGWRFYDHFRTDREAPTRLPQIGTRTPVLHHDGRDVAAALQTIREIGDSAALDTAIEDAFPGSKLAVLVSGGHFSIQLRQHGLLRPLAMAELSDGTLRYLLWIAALLTPRPPTLMVLNEPETSLHPALIPALARLIVQASLQTQVWVISHSQPLIDELMADERCSLIRLEKQLGETRIAGQKTLDRPYWDWPD